MMCHVCLSAEWVYGTARIAGDIHAISATTNTTKKKDGLVAKVDGPS